MMNGNDNNFPISQHIILNGMTGAGKTSIGKKLGETLGLEFKDLEEEIVRFAQNPIETICEYWGEEFYRDIERKVLTKLLKNPIHILAVGDSTLQFNKELILDNSLSVWINPDLQLIYNRISNRSKTDKISADFDSIIEEYIEKREIYSQSSICIYIKDSPYSESIKKIINCIKDKTLYGRNPSDDENLNENIAKEYLEKQSAGKR